MNKITSFILISVCLCFPALAEIPTAKASCELIEKLGAEIVACAFVIELDELGGREKLRNFKVHSLIHF